MPSDFDLYTLEIFSPCGLLSPPVLTDRPPPIIRQGPANQTLGVDGVALLKCQAAGDPIPTISWLKDGLSLLGKEPRMSLQEMGSLQIRGLRVRLGGHRGAGRSSFSPGPLCWHAPHADGGLNNGFSSHPKPHSL